MRSISPIEFNRTFTFYLPGFNVRSTDLNAKIGLMQMERLDAMIERRIENHRVYQQRLGNAPGFRVQRNERRGSRASPSRALCSSVEHRAAVAAALRSAGIETRPLGGGNMSRQPFWRERYQTIPLPMADRIHHTSLQLPNHHLLSLDDVTRTSATW